MPPRRSEHLKRLHGTQRPDRMPPEPPRSDETDPKAAPDWLDDYGREKWNQLIGELASRRLQTGDALSLLELICEAWADFRRAQAVVRESGGSYESKKGEKAEGATMHRKRPEVDQAREARKEYASLLARFTKLIEGIEPTDKKDPLDGFLEGGPRGRSSSAA